jgi:exonuclease SbcC
MITKIEIKNFQSHKNTVLDFDKGVNVICGESDNGKSAVIRAIRWVVENYPQGTDKINSNWNDDFKEPLSVKLYTEKGYVERIRDKKRNGYNICKNGEPEIVLDAIGKGVPKEILDFLNVSDVNFQFQLDAPYLLSKTPGEASKYLNEIVHLDSIDKIMSIADSDKLQLSSEQRIIESDIKDLESKVESTAWVDDAQQLYSRILKYNEVLEHKNFENDQLSLYIDSYTSVKIVDLSVQKNMVNEIEAISIPDISDLYAEI